MKKFCKLAIILLIVLANVIIPFAGAINPVAYSNKTVSAEEYAIAPDFSSISKSVSITQDGYVFSTSDFE